MSDFVDRINDSIIKGSKSLKGPQMAALGAYLEFQPE